MEMKSLKVLRNSVSRRPSKEVLNCYHEPVEYCILYVLVGILCSESKNFPTRENSN